jgi:hypothetical protein
LGGGQSGHQQCFGQCVCGGFHGLTVTTKGYFKDGGDGLAIGVEPGLRTKFRFRQKDIDDDADSLGRLWFTETSVMVFGLSTR